MNIPNSLTVARILLVPVFGALWLTGHHTAALWCFAVGGATDVLDGLMARALHQQTRLGAILDPAADKLTLLVAFLVAASVGGVPWWLAALVIGRDVVLSTGAAIFAFVLHGRFEPDRWRPSRIGKYSTFYQLAVIGLALVCRASGDEHLRPWVGALVWIAAALTAVSAVQYISTALLALRHRPRPRAAPAGFVGAAKGEA